MNVLRKKRIANFFISMIAATSSLAAFSCFFARVHRFTNQNTDGLNILAAKSVLSKGKTDISGYHGFLRKPYSSEQGQSDKNQSPDGKSSDYTENDSTGNSENNSPSQSDGSNDEEKHSPDEKTYKIIESQFGASGLKYENFYVKNTAGFNLDIGAELGKTPEVKIKNTGKPQVLIMHTHTSEAYIGHDRGFFYESFYPRSTDNGKNVTGVGEVIAQKLREHGINTVHDTTYHDDPSYKGSYSRSEKTVKKNLEKHPSIQVVLDIHRDSLGDRDHGKVKPTFKFKGKKGAQIMVIAGCDHEGSIGYPEWEKNLRFALRLHQKCETMFPGLTRPMFFGKVKYNMNLTRGSVLIEVGSDVNTLDEAKYSASLVGEALAGLLESLK